MSRAVTDRHPRLVDGTPLRDDAANGPEHNEA